MLGFHGNVYSSFSSHPNRTGLATHAPRFQGSHSGQEEEDSLSELSTKEKHQASNRLPNDAAEFSTKTDKAVKTKHQSKSEKTDEDVPSEEEAIDVEHPAADQFAAYNANRKRQQQEEWGRKYETPARVLDWCENQAKWVTRRTFGMSQSLADSTTQIASNTFTAMRKSVASKLRNAANALDDDSANANEESSANPTVRHTEKQATKKPAKDSDSLNDWDEE